MKNNEKKTCIIYCRVSSQKQTDGTSLESQERLCREYANRQGWEILKVLLSVANLQRQQIELSSKKQCTFVLINLER